jgi:hypothetical protein
MAGSAFCEITGTICGIDGTPKVGGQVRASIKSTEDDQGGQLADGAGVTSEMVSAITQDDGTFAIVVIQGATIFLEIPDINLKKSILVPAVTTVDFATLI